MKTATAAAASLPPMRKITATAATTTAITTTATTVAIAVVTVGVGMAGGRVDLRAHQIDIWTAEKQYDTTISLKAPAVAAVAGGRR